MHTDLAVYGSGLEGDGCIVVHGQEKGFLVKARWVEKWDGRGREGVRVGVGRWGLNFW